MPKHIPYTLVMIDPASDIQVHHWARNMQIEPHELRAAVKSVGPRLIDLRQHFGKSATVISLENRRRGRRTSPYGLPT
jgi:Protein of unknown function (DUF3606)